MQMSAMVSTQSELVREEIAKNLESYVGGGPSNTYDKEISPKSTLPVAAFHSPSNSETSSLFSTVDCSSFSSRSDASSFVKEEVSRIVSLSVSSSIEFLPGSKLAGTSSRDNSSYFEFSFVEGKVVGDEGDDSVRISGNRQLATNKQVPAANSPKAAVSLQDDAYETFPVWTDRTRYCSKDIHSCINPCFDQAGDGGELRIRTSRRKKLSKSLGSVLTKHLPLSPGPTFRRRSYDKFKSRLSIGHPSPLSERNSVATPSRAFETQEEKSGYHSSPGGARRKPASSQTGNKRLSFAKTGGEQFKMKTGAGAELSASTSGKTSLYGTSPRRVRGMEAKALGCLGMAKTVVPEDGTFLEEYKGPLYFASEDSVHGGKTRCLPSPRLSFGKTTSREENAQLASVSMSMVVPSRTVHGHVHCVVRNDTPSFTFSVDGLEEILVAKAVKSCPLDGLETGELVYTFYSWKPKGRSRRHWKNWVRRDRTDPELVGSMTFSSKVVPAQSKDGDDTMELEFVLSDGNGACSPRLSFSTWETGTSPQSSCKSPYSFPSPFSAASPSPVRLANATSSRYVAMSMVPTSLVSPRFSKRDRLRSKKSLSSSPLRPKSDDDRSSWSDSEVEAAEVKIQSSPEFAAIVIRSPAGVSSAQSVWEALNKKWSSKALRNSSRKGSNGRRFSLPGRLPQQVAIETKENQGDNKARTHSFKLRELMGVKADFGREEAPASTVTVILPAGNHGLPVRGSGGPQPLIDRWRSGGRCDCGSWDLGCGLTILEGQQELQRSKELINISLQGKNKSRSPSLRLGAISDGLFPISFQAPVSYLQAFASAIAVVYTRGPGVLDHSEDSSVRKEDKPPRIPLMPLHQRRVAYFSPPPACLLDRL
ncbi:uncharacterized protein LOC9642109 [Selaginella moellendorffii]|nr:uncharacterized protein LOC9642109 [Selaginella moellendorffii]|eukprot:XP_002971156.2 uncharacterized protein LOC9642109 [Selaginella moellendorffii]